jgi:hypothetical protein
MKRVAALCFSSLALLPAYSFAGGGTLVCSAVHFVRAEGGTELRTTVISLRNLDLVNSTTVERITIRNAYGDVVHDSGPATGQPHPSNTDFTPPLDITLVPAGANYYLATNHIWGINDIPPQTGQTPVEAAQGGQNMSATVQFSKEGKPALFVIGGSTRSRDRFAPRAERSRGSIQCTEVHGG